MARMKSDYDMLGLGYNEYNPTQSDNEIKISVLTEENEKLRKQYSDLILKTTILLEAYKKLETENDKLKTKKAKRDSVIKTVENSKNFFKNIWDSFDNWLKT